MFIGHFGLGFAAKPLAPKVSLGTLFLATQFIDLLWPSLLMLGIERVVIAPGASGISPFAFEYYPWTHSLLMASLWGLLLGASHYGLRRHWGAALVVGLLVPSHWLLDLVVHVPDLPLTPGDSPMLGLGLWRSLLGSQLLEATLFLAGIAIYQRHTRPLDRQGRWGFFSLAGLLALIQVGNVLGDPPPSAAAIAWVGQAQWLLVAWAYWVDKHRAALSD